MAVTKEFYLADILQRITPRNVEGVIEENVTEILQREKLLKKGMKIIVPQGAVWEYKPETKKESGFVGADFEIFSTPQDIVAYGMAYGLISAGNLIELTTELKPKDIKKLKKVI